MGAFYHAVLYQPLLSALIFFYDTFAFRDLGVAIVLLTVLIRFVLYPVFRKSAHHQAVMQRLQPKIKKIQEQHRGDHQKQGEAMLALYREHNVNPFSGILLLLIQLPVLIALFQIFNAILKPGALAAVYSFVPVPDHLNTYFLGITLIPLEKSSIFIAGLAALTQYFQTKLTIPKVDNARELTATERMSRQMMFVAPGITLLVLFNLPAAIGLYWITTSLFSVGQQIIINRQLAREDHDSLGNIHKGDNKPRRI